MANDAVEYITKQYITKLLARARERCFACTFHMYEECRGHYCQPRFPSLLTIPNGVPIIQRYKHWILVECKSGGKYYRGAVNAAKATLVCMEHHEPWQVGKHYPQQQRLTIQGNFQTVMKLHEDPFAPKSVWRVKRCGGRWARRIIRLSGGGAGCPSCFEDLLHLRYTF